ncbi:hypothetical protein Nizo2766_0821 [Lactiplantibacillus plantarum]|nr:hypothetical protein Nizo2766_0821 [Lactiplantibacillus plantarum]
MDSFSGHERTKKDDPLSSAARDFAMASGHSTWKKRRLRP